MFCRAGYQYPFRAPGDFTPHVAVSLSATSQVYPLGSYPLKTYLPDGDINLSAFFSHSRTSTWAERVTEEFMRVSNKRGAGAITDPTLKIGNVSFVNGETGSKMVKAQVP